MTATLEEMAREAGATVYTNRHFKTEPATAFDAAALARFAALVRAQARAEAIEDAAREVFRLECDNGPGLSWQQFAAAIRALPAKP